MNLRYFRLSSDVYLSYKQLDRVNSEESIQRRVTYARFFTNNAPLNRDNCIFIDESGFNLHLRRSKARSRVVTRANIIVPTVRGKNTTVIVVANQRGIIHFKIISNGTFNAEKFN